MSLLMYLLMLPETPELRPDARIAAAQQFESMRVRAQRRDLHRGLNPACEKGCVQEVAVE